MGAESTLVGADDLCMSKGRGTGGWAPCEFSNVFHIKQCGRAGNAAIKVGCLDADIYGTTSSQHFSAEEEKKAGRSAGARTRVVFAQFAMT